MELRVKMDLDVDVFQRATIHLEKPLNRRWFILMPEAKCLSWMRRIPLLPNNWLPNKKVNPNNGILPPPPLFHLLPHTRLILKAIMVANRVFFFFFCGGVGGYMSPYAPPLGHLGVFTVLRRLNILWGDSMVVVRGGNLCYLSCSCFTIVFRVIYLILS